MAEREQHDIGLVIARLLLGGLFMVMGWYKFGDIAGLSEFLAEEGLPAAGALAWLAAIIEMAGGIALILGVFPGPVALVLALYLIPATLKFHGDLEVQWQITNLIKNAGIIGGLIAIWSCRGGRIRLT